MRYCEYCGKQIPDDSKLCPYCGAEVSGAAAGSGSNSDLTENQSRSIFDTEDLTHTIDAVDVRNNKVMGVLSYISVLVLIPLLFARDSAFARFHANQGLVLFIAETLITVMRTILSWILSGLPIIGGLASWAVGLLFGLASLGCLLLSVIGIINAAQGTAKRLPIVGGITLIK